MDVYIKLGLLSVAAIILIYMLIDGWRKNRAAAPTSMERIGQHKRVKTTDPEFVVSQDPTADLFSEEDYVGPVRIVNPNHSELTDKLEQVLVENTTENTVPPAALPSESMMRRAKQTSRPKAPTSSQHLLILSVMAKPDLQFASYDLLQAISNAGLQFGDMNIFHYFQPTLNGKVPLFSLASANKPGDFDMDNIGDFTCSGLMLFMDIAQVSDAQYAFRLMLETATQLAEDLDGELHATPHTPWNEKLAWKYQQKIIHSKIAMSHERVTN